MKITLKYLPYLTALSIFSVPLSSYAETSSDLLKDRITNLEKTLQELKESVANQDEKLTDMQEKPEFVFFWICPFRHDHR